MKRTRKLLAILLIVPLILSCGTSALAADNAGKSVSAAAHAVDKTLGVMHDAAFGMLQGILTARSAARSAAGLSQPETPTYEDYVAKDHPQIYDGTDGVVQGGAWRAGYAEGSIIPTEWRRNAKGEIDPNGWCLDKSHPTGGYQNQITKIYTDQILNVFLLSNGSDSNGNGVADIVLFVCVDGVGVSAGTCKKIRAGIEEALQPLGVTAGDVLACSVSASHCHNALDTQGMSAGVLLKKIFVTPLDKFGRSIDETMEKTMVKQAAACAKTAYTKAENGTLRFFETAPINLGDKLGCGAQKKNAFSGFLFEGVNGEKTILANIGSHPVSYWKNGDILFADYPYFMRLAMRDAGYNFLFTQSAQANIGTPNAPADTSEARSREAAAWAQKYALSKEDWVERYSKKYADKYYEGNRYISEKEFEGDYEKGYKLAHFILDAAPRATAVSTNLEVRSQQTLLRLENGLMAMGCISGLLGEDTVKCPDAESGYGVMAETNYIAIGDDVVILTAPGELYPALLLGTDPDYDEPYLWTGKTSWTGEEWSYDTLESIVRKATGDSDKHVLLLGITNDALGYIYPDVMMPQSILATLMFYNCESNHKDDMANSVLLTTGSKAASQIMEGYIRLIGQEPDKTDGQ